MVASLSFFFNDWVVIQNRCSILLYLFKSCSAVFDVIGKEDEHTEFVVHIRQLNHFEIHCFHDKNWKCMSHVHHLHRLGLVL